MKEKLETGAMLNPICQDCSKRDTCNNKTLCAYLIPKEIGKLIMDDIKQELLNKPFNIGIDLGSCESTQSYIAKIH